MIFLKKEHSNNVNHVSIYNVDLNAPQQLKPKLLIVPLPITVIEPKNH
jgi:hypothetical protein